MTHVLFVTGEFPPQQGGVGAYTLELCRALAKLDVDTSVVTSASVAVSPEHTANDPTVHNTVGRWDWRIWREIDKLARSTHVEWVHVQYQTAAFNMNPAINFAPQRWHGSQDSFRVAWTYHDLLVPYLFPKAGDRLRRWVTVQPARTSDLSIVTNEGDLRTLSDLDVTNLHKIVIGSNIQGRIMDVDERRARRQERRYHDDDRVLAYFGFLNRSKGVTTLIRALHRLTDDYPTVKLLMIGERVGASDPTNYAFLQEVEALIAELDLADRIQWTDRQPDSEVAADLNACDLLVLPYVDGASPRRGTLMAGLANGCAIVTTTPQTPLPELVDERELLYVAPENDVALAKIISRALNNPALVERLRRQARTAIGQFDWDKIAAEHVALYERDV